MAQYSVYKQHYSNGSNLRDALNRLLNLLYGDWVFNYDSWDGDSRVIPLTGNGFTMYAICTNVGGDLYHISLCDCIS